jgi:hypothetical protein
MAACRVEAAVDRRSGSVHPAHAAGGGYLSRNRATHAGGIRNELERAADEAAERVVGMPDPGPALTSRSGPGSAHGGGIPTVPDDELSTVGGRLPSPAPRPAAQAAAVRALRGPGQPLPHSLEQGLSARFGQDLDRVRVHTHPEARRAAAAAGARAFTVGHDIGFASGQYAPHTTHGRRLLAHELAHVLQQRGLEPLHSRPQPGRAHLHGVQFDLAVAPPSPGAEARMLSEVEIEEAIRYNAFRFKDPYSLAAVRDVVGIPRFPAVSDRDLALAVAQWQAEFNLTVDGMAGPRTTATLVTELRAEGLPDDARQLRQDNFVTTSTVGAVTRTVPTPASHGLFRWDVSFTTSLRRGWLIQRLDNTWNETVCGGAALPVPPTGRYWEAWWVDNSGTVQVPTSTATPPTTAATPGYHDRWQRPTRAGTRGSFTMNARLYTTLRLPAAGFAIGNVADAGILPSTTTAPASDDLGLVEATRRASGNWNGCPPPAVNAHTGTP